MQEMYALARHAAKQAGDALASKSGDFSGIAHEDGRDIKLNADAAAETLILDLLKAGSDYPILAEESGAHGVPEGLFWVVDPLDGSANYIRGVPLCAVAIALMRDTQPVYGVIYDFNRNEMFCGGEGEAATLNDAPISVSDVSQKAKAQRATGLPVKGDFSAEALGAMAAEFADWKKIRMVGTAAIAAAWVTCGRFDRYDERGARLWDVAAGMAIAEAAGGRSRLSYGAPDAPRDVLIDNGRLPL